MLQAAQDTRSKATVDIFLVESAPKNYKKLREVAALFRQNGINVQDRQGTIDIHLPPIITAADGAALFLFLDPCGALLPFKYMQAILTGPRKKGFPPTEAFLNFSDGLVRRAAGQYLKQSSDQDGAECLDSVCGGVWWRSIADQLRPVGINDNYEPIALAVADEYARRLGAAANMASISVPVRKKLEHQPIYHLVFLTRHPEGVYSFADSLAAARPDWLEAMPNAPDLTDEDLFTGAGVTLDGATLAAQMKRQALREQADSVTHLAANILNLAASGKRFRVIDHLPVVLDGVLGIATEKQLRAALNGLVKEKRITLVTKDSRIQRNLYEAPVTSSL
jgi:three-Cys-motif partner protein